MARLEDTTQGGYGYKLSAVTLIPRGFQINPYLLGLLIKVRSLLPLFGDIRAARKRHANDLSEDEFFDQQRRGQRERQTADDYQTLQHRFHD